MSGVVCSICLQQYKIADEICSTLCGHIFHTVCIGKWQRRSQKCPQCNARNTSTRKIFLNIEDEHERNGNKLRQMQQKLAESIEKNSTLEQANAQLEQSLQEKSELDAQIQEMRASLDRCEIDKTELQSELEVHQLSLSQYMHDNDELQTKLHDIESTHEVLQHELADAIAKNSTLDAQLEQSLQEKSKIDERELKSQLEVSLSLSQYIHDIYELQTKLHDMESTHEKLQQELAESIAKNSILQNQADSNDGYVHILAQQRGHIQNELNRKSAKLSIMAKELKALSDQFDDEVGMPRQELAAHNTENPDEVIIIKGFPVPLEKKVWYDTVTSLAEILDIEMTRNAVKQVNLEVKKDGTYALVVTFQVSGLMDKFLSCNEKLASLEKYKDCSIEEYTPNADVLQCVKVLPNTANVVC